MPYIENKDKKDLDKSIGAISNAIRNGDFRGRLNYTISSIFSHLIEANGVSYRLINDFIGVLECAKMEAYRRIAIPYEDSKISANGDVFPPSNVIIRNCLSCGVGGEVFSIHGDCLDCVMQKAGFDKKVKSLLRQDVDIESLVDEEHKE